MPWFVIVELNKPARTARVDAPLIKIGRDPTNDVVLAGATVSRAHCLFHLEPDGTHWQCACASAKNPIVINGQLVDGATRVFDGAEVLLGTEHLVAFFETETGANLYVARSSGFQRRECVACHWKGLVSAIRRDPKCPKCGGTELVLEDAYHREQEAAKASAKTTLSVSPEQARALFKQLKTAKRSHIERLDGKADRNTRQDLNEDKATAMTKEENGPLKLFGLSWGTGVTVKWDKSAYVVTADLVYPSMKVNGEASKSARLKNGDVIEIGANKFKFVTE